MVYTKDNKTLENIDANAQENKIEVIKVNGKPQPIIDKVIDLDIASEVGVSDYNELKNKPQLNNITLENNKSLSDLDIASEKYTYFLADSLATTSLHTQWALDAANEAKDDIKTIKTDIENVNALISNVNYDLNLEITRALNAEENLNNIKQDKLLAGKGIFIEEDSNSNSPIIGLSENYVTTTEFKDKIESLTAAIIEDLDGLQENKQNVLTAGFGIKINNDIISLDIEPEEESGSYSDSTGGSSPILNINTSDLKTTNTLWFDGDKVDRVMVNSKDMVATGNNLKYLIRGDNEYIDVKKAEYDDCQFLPPDIGVGYKSIIPGYTETLDFFTYKIDENTVFTVGEIIFELPIEYEDRLVPLYHYRTGSDMYSFELWTDEFVNDMTGMGAGAMMRKVLLQAYGMDEMSTVKVCLVDPSYLFGKPSLPYLGAFIRGLNGKWKCMVAYQFYWPIPETIIGNGIGRYRVCLQHWVWEDIQQNMLNIMDLENDLMSLKGTVNSLDKYTDELQSSINTLSTKVNTLETSISNVSENITELDNELSALQINLENRVTSLEGNTNSMLTRLELIENKVTSLEQMMGNVLTRLDAIEAKLNQ